VADTPGHEQYTRNMVTGASTADAAVILIDARKGVLTQTRRHSYLVTLLGIRRLVVAINKMDMVDYSSEVFAAIEAARILMKSGVKPRRTIRFTLWSGEEQGLLGSWAYTKSHEAELDQIKAVVVFDSGVGRVTGYGLAENMRRYYPAPVLYLLVGLLVVANTINLGADLGAMAAALRLLVPGPAVLYIGGFAIVTVVLEVFTRYQSYASVLRWLTLSLFAYVATVFVVGVESLPVKADASAAAIGFQLHFKTLARAAIMGLYKR